MSEETLAPADWEEAPERSAACQLIAANQNRGGLPSQAGAL